MEGANDFYENVQDIRKVQNNVKKASIIEKKLNLFTPFNENRSIHMNRASNG